MDSSSVGTVNGLTRRTVLGRGALFGAVLGASQIRRADAQEAVNAEIVSTRDVVYNTVNDKKLKLDVVQPSIVAGLRPAVILVHGGGLTEGGRYEFLSQSEALARAGYVAFSIDYRLFNRSSKTNPWPAQLDDAQRAVRWIRANAATYDVDPERIGAFGVSSGGQLVGFLGTRETRDNSDPVLADFSSKVTCAVTLGGSFDMTFPNNDPFGTDIDAEILGGSLDALPVIAAYQDFSPVTFVDETSAPFLIFQEGDDSIVPIEHSRRMVAALQDARVEVIYAWMADANHFFWMSWPNAAAETLAFFGRHLRPDDITS